MSVKVRFAPSPTGLLHVGNIRAALLNWLFAKQHDGRFLLRIDDTDAGRSREDHVLAIREDLAWLGIAPDEEVRQSQRLDRYRAAADRLRAAGRLYACYETAEELDFKRRMQRTRGLPPVYDRAALQLTDGERARLGAEGRAPHWRFRLDTDARVVWTDLVRGHQEVDPASLSDPVLIRADGSFLYMLPSTVDDIELGISHVIRGEDHVTNTAEQMQIFAALGADLPEFGHYPLMKARDGGKFSKRAGSATIRLLREENGIEPETLMSLLARLGSADPVVPMIDIAGLVAGFDLSHFSKSSVIFDPAELDQLNAKILHLLPWERVAGRPEMAGVSPALWEAVRGNLAHLGEVGAWLQVTEGNIPTIIDAADRAFLTRAAEALPDTLDATSWSIWTEALKAETGRKGRALFLPLRRALTGRDQGPDMATLLPLIGTARARERLRGKG